MVLDEFPHHKKYCIEVIIDQRGAIVVGGIDGLTSPVAMFGSTGNSELDVKWSWSQSHFELKNDRYGMFQIFYTKLDNGTVLISNYIEKILEKGGSADFDDDAIAVFLRLGYYLGKDTPFKHIKCLAAKSVVRITNKGLEITEGKKISETSVTPSYADAVKDYGEIFQGAMQDYLCEIPDHHIMVPISGGQDSRHILLSILEAGREIQHCVTSDRLPPDDNPDVIVAEQFCDFVGLKNVLVNQKTQDLVDQEIFNFHLSSYCADENNWALSVANYFRKLEQPTVLFDGLAGDCLSASAWNNQAKLAMYRSGKLTDLAQLIIRSEGILLDFLTPQQKARWSKERAVTRIAKELETYQHTVSPFAHFYFWNRAVREIGHIPRTWLGRFGAVCTPYLFEPVFDYLINLPAEYSLGKKFHGEVIATRYPKYADFPYAKHKATRVAPFSLRYQFNRDCLRYFQSTPNKSEVINYQYLLPRFVKGLLSSQYGTSMLSIAVSPLYLATLYKLQDKYPRSKK